ncbi:MAG: DEAD/DEAH box helicase [Leptolyngbyaceae bacterium]|nr:DEAD/DEAH box helicase [Leptolyngbyaceae bacterium]
MMSQSSHRPPLTYAATEPSSTQRMVAAASDATDAVYDADKTTKPLAAETSKPMPDILPGITLTPEQQQTLKELEAFVRGRRKLHLLTGYAGTGKTTLLQALIKKLRQGGDRRKIVLTAFSNKATKVLATMANRWQLTNVDALTCCKLLGLKPDIDPTTGKQIFKPDPGSENTFDRYRLVIVDEASMINAEMWLLLTNAVSDLHKRTQVLFVGDIAQLPPIGERESKAFSEIYDRSDLTQVVRYGGAIGVLAESIRNNLDNRYLPKFTAEMNGDRTEGVTIAPLQQWEKLIIRAFQSDHYKDDPDYVRVLAYTNQRVNYLNQLIRQTIYGPDTPRFVKGERLIANAPCFVKDNIVLQNSGECEVLEVTTGQDGEWSVWYLQVLTDEGNIRHLTVLHELNLDRFNQRLREYAGLRRWQEYWDLKTLFHNLSYAYCLTIHKSQGSTFQNVFVDIPNTLNNRNIQERNQLLYVAVTRAAQRLFIYQ